MPETGTLALALGAGLVAALNPCGFALLPAYLSILVLDEQPGRVVAVGRALRATVAMTTGFVSVFAFFGLAVAPVAASVQLYLPVFTVALGVAVAAAGGWVILGHRLPTLHLRRRSGSAKPLTLGWASMAGFGASYALASLACTIAPFLAVVVTAFRAGSIGDGLILFLTYTAGMSLVVGTTAVAVALARTGLVGRLRRAGAALPRLGGVILVAAGAYVAWYGAWELRLLHSTAGGDRVVDQAARLQQWLATAAERIGPGGFVIALAALLAAAWLLTRDRSRQPPVTTAPGTLTRGAASRHAAGRSPRMQAMWNGDVVAESDDIIVVEGAHYFPQESLHQQYFAPSTTKTICPWKGLASYYHLTVDGETNPDAAWRYQHPLPFARNVRNRVAFWHGVQITPAADRDSRANR